MVVTVIDTRSSRRIGFENIESRDTAALRKRLSDGFQGERIIDAQRCSKETCEELSRQYMFDIELLEWAQGPSSSDSAKGQAEVMDKVWHFQNNVNNVRVFLGFDCLRILSEELHPEFGILGRMKPRFQLASARARKPLPVFTRRFSCGIIVEKQMISERPRESHVFRTLFICESPQAGLQDTMPYLRYQLWDMSMSPLSFLEDVVGALVSDIEEVVDHASMHVSMVEDDMLGNDNPASMHYASRLVRDRLAWASLVTVIKSMLQYTSRLAETLGEFLSDTPILMTERDDLTKLLERVESELVTRTEFLIGLNTNVANLEEARAAVEQGESLKRISWLTFIFLPLMFMASIFGMNVDWFANNPEAKWYFVAAAVQLVVVLAVYVGTKYYMRRKKRENYSAEYWRGLDEV
ncbi:hypothetical protein NA57DRAFT_75540 [Rhizodiscina lignyota]|uniref:Uncharacterized protein n=1 Tax=Rhizodiscina lignyota TaxID=1504668 RepID=A0A9P4IK96_9PEZI|nr:hypothetical protein NA57DRAFT_75540 [Rhizodiscina lignyota]